MKLKILPAILLVVVFSFLSLKTLPDYGVNWDTYQHLVRGHIYLRFLTSGRTDKPDPIATTRISYYQQSPLDFAWTEKMTIGHPPLSDIIMAAINRLIWGKFGWVGDIESHHLYVVFMTTVMVFLVGIWSFLTFGPLASFASVLSIVTLPQLFAEQHFNIKDPLVAAYYTGALFFLWFAAEYKRVWPVIISALFFGLSLGTKFNILFSFFILFFWSFSLRWWEKRRLRKLVLFAVILIPLVSFGMFLFTYPALWSDPVGRTFGVIRYYQQVSQAVQKCPYYFGSIPWLLRCSDWKTPVFFASTTPIPTLLLFVVGCIIGWKYAFRKSGAVLIWLVWITITVGRATVPIMSLYGGSLRQIMEYVAPLSLISGMAFVLIVDKFKTGWTKGKVIVCILILFIPVVVKMIRIHPNENVYYNLLTGGLPGAVSVGLEGADNTYGNAYKQGIKWLNAHAEQKATVSYGVAIFSTVPTTYYRNDIRLIGDRSILPAQKGEYIMELAYPGMNVNDVYRMRYALNFLKPIYTVTVEDVPLLFIWKNDPDHMNPGVNVRDDVEINPKRKNLDVNVSSFSDMNGKKLKRLEFSYVKPACHHMIENIVLNASSDLGRTWYRLWGSPRYFPDERQYYHINDVYLLTGEKPTDLKIYSYPQNDCQLSDVNITFISFP